jgi:hypothetical protein
VRHVARHARSSGKKHVTTQPARPDDLLLRPRARQQLINNLVGQLASQVIRHALKDPRRGRRLAWRLAGARTVRDPRSLGGILLSG